MSFINMAANKLIIREKEKMLCCPKCFKWHRLYMYRPSVGVQTLLVFCSGMLKTKLVRIQFPYQEIEGIQEYKDPQGDNEMVFIRKELKIVPKVQYQNPKLF